MKQLLTLLLCGLPLAVMAQTYSEEAVAAVLMGEAWSEGIRGMTAVADVIRQRAREKDCTPLQVVEFHRGRVHAFSCLNGTTLDQLIEKFRSEPDFQQALRLAQIVCRTPDRLPGLVGTANHYTRATERPLWVQGRRPLTTIGKHAFYRLNHY